MKRSLPRLLHVANFLSPSHYKVSSQFIMRTSESKTLHDGHALPKLFVFDLDFTLWPFWVDTHVTGPVKTGKHTNAVLDKDGEKYGFFQDVPSILTALRANPSISVGAASRTHAPDLARKTLKALKIPKDPHAHPTPISLHSADPEHLVDAISLFNHMEIYPGDKTRHFASLKKTTGLRFADMIFFDDEGRNRDVEEKYGVHFVHVEDGVSWRVIDDGIAGWRRRWGHEGHELVEWEENEV